MDDVLVEFQQGWISYNNSRYGTSYVFEDFTDFDWSIVMKIPLEEAFRRLFEFYETEEFHKLVPIKESLENLHDLALNNSLMVITSRPSTVSNASIKWLNTYYPHLFKQVLFTRQITKDGFDHKVTKADLCRQYQVDWLVEDAPFHAEQVANAGVKVALLEKPWNKNVKLSNSHIHRIKVLTELPILLEK